MDEKEIKEITRLEGVYKTISNEAILEGEQAIVIHAERLLSKKAEDKLKEDEESLII